MRATRPRARQVIAGGKVFRDIECELAAERRAFSGEDGGLDHGHTEKFMQHTFCAAAVANLRGLRSRQAGKNTVRCLHQL